MSTENHEDKPVIFNTPSGFNFSELFGDLSIKFKPKVEFLIHQINYYNKSGGYQINSKNHKLFFGIKGTELAEIIRRLVANGIIKLVVNFAPGNTSNAYKMVTPFNVDDPTTQKSYYYPDQILFIRKWIADGFIVKSAATTKFKKELKTTHAAIIAEQSRQISELQAQVSALLVQSKGGAQYQILDDCKPVQVSGFTAPIRESLMIETKECVSQWPVLKAKEDSRQVQPPALITLDANDSANEEEQDLKDLALMFGEEIAPFTNNVVDLPIIEVPPAQSKKVIDSSLQQLNIVKNEGVVIDLPERQSFLNGTLTVHHFADDLFIENGDKVGWITNFELIKTWCLPMDDFEKQRFYHHLITSKGNNITFALNVHTKALFTRKEVDGCSWFTYQNICAT